MLPAQLDSIDESHLKALVTNGVREARSLEFKTKLVWATESEKKEFLADVSALANGGGGDLILGNRGRRWCRVGSRWIGFLRSG